MSERLFLRLDGDPLYTPETAVPAGTMRDFAVSTRLHDAVSGVIAYREDIPAGHEVTERVLPDGALRLIVHFDGTTGARAVVAGASTQPVLLRLSGRMHGFSVALRPGAAAMVLGLPAAEAAGPGVPLEALWPEDGPRLLDALAGAPDDATRAGLLQAALLRRLRPEAHGLARQTAHAARLITASGGRRPLREVADAIGVGERRLQQLFRAHVGLSPREWSRLSRLHACLRALRRPGPPRWAELALDAGYCDQSHLVNEFRALCGLSPGELTRTISVSSKTAA